MDIITLSDKIRKTIRDKREQLTELITSGSAKDMEQYRHLIGQLDALNFIEQELSNLLEKQENDD
jgi:Tfp pilus assembly pilus retraction ATPase PilT